MKKQKPSTYFALKEIIKRRGKTRLRFPMLGEINFLAKAAKHADSRTSITANFSRQRQSSLLSCHSFPTWNNKAFFSGKGT